MSRCTQASEQDRGALLRLRLQSTSLARHMVIVCKASRLERKTLHGTYIHNIQMFSIVFLSHMS